MEAGFALHTGRGGKARPDDPGALLGFHTVAEELMQVV
jgi:hypothetical protein